MSLADSEIDVGRIGVGVLRLLHGTRTVVDMIGSNRSKHGAHATYMGSLEAIALAGDAIS
jgi:hypothetical protein